MSCFLQWYPAFKKTAVIHGTLPEFFLRKGNHIGITHEDQRIPGIISGSSFQDGCPVRRDEFREKHEN
jgi:hypothetical protein